jgi:protease-4
MQRVVLVAVMLGISTVAYGQHSGTSLPVYSVSDPDGANALLTNPGGLSLLRTWETRIINTQMTDGAGEGSALLYTRPLLGSLSMGFGLELLRPPSPDSLYARVSTGLGLRLGKRLTLGMVWRHSEGEADAAVDGLDTVDFGLVWRPWSTFSFGAAIHDLNNPSVSGVSLSRRYELGVTVRPGTERVSLDAGVMIHEESGDLDATARVRVEPMKGLELAGTLQVSPRGDETHLAIGAGLTLNFGSLGFGGGAVISRPAEQSFGFDGYSVGVRLTGGHYNSLYQRPGKTILVELGSVSETPKPTLLSGGRPTFVHILRAVSALEDDESVSGVLIRDRRSSLGWAQTEELRRVILSLRERGKRVTAYLDHGSIQHAYLYSAADQIVLNPAGGLKIVGLTSTLSFYRDMLDKIGVDTQWVRYGKYKSYPEQFERADPSEESQFVKNSLLDALYNQLLSGIADGRKLTVEKVRQIVDDGPYVGQEAVDAGLVDTLAFWDEIESVLKKQAGKAVLLSRLGAGSHSAQRRWGRRSVVAIIPVIGQIVEGGSRTVFGLGTKMVGSDTLIHALKVAEADPNVVGIVLRVNSPGGSSMASDLIQRKVSQVAKKKPIVVSFGNIAASGGYYVAMGASEVLSSDATVTGSIGIFTAKPSFGRLLQWLGIGRATFKRGKYADLFNQDRPWNEDELKRVSAKVKHFYDLFLKRVETGRKLKPDVVAAAAQGRVWLGSQAREQKLVDGQGGVLDAIDRVCELAGLDDSKDVGIRFLPRKSLIERVRSTLGVEIETLVDRMGLRDALSLSYPFLVGYEPGEALMLMPFSLTID